MSQALYRKWRPKVWGEVIGQEHVVQTLHNAVAGQHVAHAYLFSGPRGTGKTSVARILAKAVNCLNENLADRPCNSCDFCKAVNENRFLDLIEIDAASNTGVDDVRDLREKINFSPNQGKYKVYIIDEVHMLSTAAFNALLKTLEEPPSHAIFILATTEFHKIPSTVLSRCQRHEFRRLPVKEITAQLEKLLASEKLEAEPEALVMIARQATGSMRDAISLLDQLSSTGQKITLELTRAIMGTATSQTITDMFEALREKDSAEGLKVIHQALDAGTDARGLARQMVDYLRSLLLYRMGNEADIDLASESRAMLEEHAKAYSPDQLLLMIRLFNSSASDLRNLWQPCLPLELAFIEALEVVPGKGKLSPPSTTEVSNKIGMKNAPVREGVQPIEMHSAAEKSESVDTGLMQKVAQSWKQISTYVKAENPSLSGLLNTCKLLEIQDGVLVLGLSSDLLISKMDKPEQLILTGMAIKEVVGIELKVRCVATNVKKSPSSKVKQDGMVAAALQAGGEIVDVQE